MHFLFFVFKLRIQKTRNKLGTIRINTSDLVFNKQISLLLALWMSDFWWTSIINTYSRNLNQTFIYIYKMVQHWHYMAWPGHCRIGWPFVIEYPMGNHLNPEQRQTSTTYPGFEPKPHSMADKCIEHYVNLASSQTNLKIIFSFVSAKCNVPSNSLN